MRRLGALLCLGIAACSLQQDAVSRYERWLESGHRSEASAYQAFLRTSHVDQAVAIQELLRSGRRWRLCRSDEFAVPPREAWASIEPTLRLVAELRSAGLLEQAQVASAWRSETFNRCEGGSSQSRHLANNALDFDLAGDVSVETLCDYWRRHGAARKFGLGFYSSRQIHIDTSGFRTWGADYHRGSSLCARRSESARFVSNQAG